MKIDQKVTEKIKEYYLMGYSYEEMASMLNISVGSISLKIKVMAQNGEVERHSREVIRINEDGTYYCSLGTCHKCEYGTSKSHTECNYMLRTHKMRGCDPTKCDKFVEFKGRRKKLEGDDEYEDY